MDLGVAWIALAGVVGVVLLASTAKRIMGDLKWLREAPTYNMVIRSFVTVTFVGSYAFGFLLVIREVTQDAESLQNVEGFGLVLALVGGYVERIIEKLYADQT